MFNIFYDNYFYSKNGQPIFFKVSGQLKLMVTFHLGYSGIRIHRKFEKYHNDLI